jgi:Protein of unknown function (DUF1588)/Protein of unknown function (DUF1592)/Protein of unknown function (DUF1595)
VRADRAGSGVLGLAFALALAGCGKTAREGASAEGGTAPTTETGGAGSGGAGPLGVGLGGQDVGGLPGLDCEAGAGPGLDPAPLARLSNEELNNSVRALLPSGTNDVGLPWLPADEAGYAALPNVSTEAVHALAHAVALRLTTDGAAFLGGCDPGARGDDECREALLFPFVERAYRRPLEDEDREELAAVFAAGRELGGDFASGARAVIEVALENPDFVYLIERGTEPVPGDALVDLTSYERAARLSYFLTASPPDDELWAAAKAKELDAAALAKHAERLLDSRLSGAQLSRFYARWVGAGTPSEITPLGFDASLAADAAESSRRFVEDVLTRRDGTFRALLTEPSTWTNGALAEFYGFSATGAAWQKVMLEPAQRGGLFTQPAFLASTSHGASTSAVTRGLLVLERLLCYDVPTEPADLVVPLPEVPSNPTERAQLEAATNAPQCTPCHSALDSVGFAFGHYDAVGRWRDTDAGLAVDSSGNLDRTAAAGSFEDALELMQRIAETDDAKRCFVKGWLERAGRVAIAPLNPCNHLDVNESFIASDGNIRQLLLTIAKSATFRRRFASELLQSER